MTPDEIDTALQMAFNQCCASGCPLSEQQKQILLQIVEQFQGNSTTLSDADNPLDELTSEEVTALLEFVTTEQEQNRFWKVQLLNDWLQAKDSGRVQFIRDRYGLQWLNRVQLHHFDKYADTRDSIKLKVGDRIEVSNALWEWVQDNGPCQREWFPCIVIEVNEINNGNESLTTCLIRFLNGTEYEIQGIYEWNRCNWRASKS
ncbi:hypothetical protein B6N60_01668 [Richelia sinica FACHB-800]|uniref:Uncharacterized protein n=1 Tax=Richelia sinica FACHB-800 TaxID=1357546 RepID=A0A975Y4A6_9NOST|nr:hypothetical protein [Richelia sinica]MBD2666317.1 hypothetical protein [Richelia sinica FACHB-800]QXE22981.1 hypothetical protein B6N60_01668 [Richelia sinica FACHB-800]